tara:strand:+ start:543 stop:1211 length:669 start_codon:yes stop_codon:yes gene_type:complete
MKDEVADGFKTVQSMVEGFSDGGIFVHPTDSLPGLAFDPKSPDSLDSVARLKGRRLEKGYLGLVSSLAMAEKFWLPLPVVFHKLLDVLWPGPLTVVWEASHRAPVSLVRKDGTLALRYPMLVKNDWLYGEIEKFGVPIPSTSINDPGKAPKSGITEALEFLKSVPFSLTIDARARDEVQGRSLLPSTLIKLRNDGNIDVLRQGSMPESRILAALEHSRRGDH